MTKNVEVPSSILGPGLNYLFSHLKAYKGQITKINMAKTKPWLKKRSLSNRPKRNKSKATKRANKKLRS